MKRVELFEFEDFEWFPDVIRSGMTRLLAALNRLMRLDEAIAKLVNEILHSQQLHNIVDLGSGSGGVMPDVYAKLKANKDNVTLTLSDLHPSSLTASKYNSEDDGISYLPKSIDASRFKEIPNGLKTMVNSFHHMPPAVATSILKSASDNGQALLIFEMRENNVPLLIWWLFLPVGLLITFLMAIILTPFSKPITLGQLFFTFIIPIIPICFAWDGQTSLPRMYSVADLKEMTDNIKNDAYTWKQGYGEKENGKKIGTYLLGLPTKN